MSMILADFHNINRKLSSFLIFIVLDGEYSCILPNTEDACATKPHCIWEEYCHKSNVCCSIVALESM